MEVAVLAPTLSKMTRPPIRLSVGRENVPLMTWTLPDEYADSKVPAPVMTELGWKICELQAHSWIAAPADTLNVPVLLPLPNRSLPLCTLTVPLLLNNV